MLCCMLCCMLCYVSRLTGSRNTMIRSTCSAWNNATHPHTHTHTHTHSQHSCVTLALSAHATPPCDSVLCCTYGMAVCACGTPHVRNVSAFVCARACWPNARFGVAAMALSYAMCVCVWNPPASQRIACCTSKGYCMSPSTRPGVSMKSTHRRLRYTHTYTHAHTDTHTEGTLHAL